MIDHLRNMAIFQTVAEMGSFRKAAAHLNLSPSVVSHHVAKLEAEVGMPLLYRSTRRMSLTESGKDLLEAAQRMSAAAQAGLSALQHRAEIPRGTLTITAATPLGQRPFSDIFTSFSEAYPGVQLSVQLSNANVPLEGSGFDMAIRGSARDLNDSSYRARKIGHLTFCVFAARRYAEARPTPRSLADLAQWDWIRSQPLSWDAATAGAAEGPGPTPVLTTDNFALARRFVEAGLGFMIEALPLVADDIARGTFVRLLPDLPLPEITVYAVTPANSPRDSLARLFVDHVVAHTGFAQ